MHLKSTPEFGTEVYFTPETTTTRTEEHRTKGVNPTTASVSQNSTVTFTGSINATTPRAESSKSKHNNDSVKGDFGAEVISGCVVGSLAVLVLIAVVVITLYKMKRKSRSNVRTARSNTQMSFDNLSFDEEIGDRRNSDFVDMTDFEVLRSNIVSSIKRKVTAFSNSASKENEQEISRKISCGRLSIVETLESTSIDIGEIVQTIEV